MGKLLAMVGVVLASVALVGSALADLGRCAEAADWQRKLIARAVEERNDELQAKLKTDLQRYESCRGLKP